MNEVIPAHTVSHALSRGLQMRPTTNPPSERRIRSLNLSKIQEETAFVGEGNLRTSLQLQSPNRSELGKGPHP
eukprot:5056775-Amphidinium_carterae.1